MALLWSDLVVTETERNLSAKAPDALTAFERFREAVAFEEVLPNLQDTQRATGVVDGKDAPIVAAAVSGSANWIASYDRRRILALHSEIQSEFGIIATTPDVIISRLLLNKSPLHRRSETV